jgi:hypothetical protein
VSPKPLPVWIIGVIVLMRVLLITTPQAEETTDLWYLMSSYEDQKITTEDLADFLTAHGYQATPHENYVAANVPGKKLYLVPNGASQGLADVYLIPPRKTGENANIDKHDDSILSNAASKLTRVPGSLDIKEGVTYTKTNNREFTNAVRKAALFPIAPYGMCFEGSKRMGRIYADLGYNVMYMYNPDNPKGQGHEWILVKDEAAENTWQAVDSYYGTMDMTDYYYAPYSFPKHDNINLIMPQLIV